MATLPLILPNGKPTDDAVLHAKAHSMARAMDGDPYPPEDDYAIPFASDDQVIECGCNDPCYGDPAQWPEWTDADWFEPTQDDIEFLNRNAYGSEPFEPKDADLEEMHQESIWQDRLDGIRRDDDHQAEVRARFG
jgi:hypothetical protein